MNLGKSMVNKDKSMTSDEILNHNWTLVNPDFTTVNQLSKSVPRSPGLYQIYTNTPKEILLTTGVRNNRNRWPSCRG